MIIKQCISLSLVFLISFSLFAQEDTPFGKYVFKGVSIGYDEESQALIKPKDGDSRKSCRHKLKPERYDCTRNQGLISVYLKEDSPGNFETTVFHPAEQGRSRSVSISTVVKEGKVDQQSTCYYNDSLDPAEGIDTRHYTVRRLECYVASAKMCRFFSDPAEGDFVSEEKFQEFVGILKSPEYKRQLLKAQKLNYRNIFLHSNRDDNYEHYSKLQKGFYDDEVQGKNENLSIINFENTPAVKESKSFSELVGRKKSLVIRAFLKPCDGLNKNNIIAGVPIDKETVDALERSKNKK